MKKLLLVFSLLALCMCIAAQTLSAPTNVTANPSTIAIGNSSNISATSVGAQIRWYTQSSGGTAFATVASNTEYTVSPSASIGYYAESYIPSSTGSLYINMTPNAAARGLYFNVTNNSATSATLSKIIFQEGSGIGDSYAIYYRTSSYVGYTTNSGAWTFLGNYTDAFNSSVAPWPFMYFDISSANVSIPAGTTYGFYVFNNSASNNSTISMLSGNQSTSDSNIAVSSTAYNTTLFGSTANYGANIGVAYTINAAVSTTRTSVSLTVNQEPTTQATGVAYSSIGAVRLTATWSNGNGGNRIVFMKQASSDTATPTNGSTYTANHVFSGGSQIGSTGWYCVYKGTGSSVTVTGLSPETSYIVQVFEYNGTAGNEAYNKNSSTNNPNTALTTTMIVAPAGSGTESDPYQIATLYNLYWIGASDFSSNKSKYYIQTANIDASETSDWFSGQGWVPLGNLWNNSFNGYYDGQGYSISNLYINRPSTDYVALFGDGRASTLKNINLVNANITGKDYVGGIVGIMAENYGVYTTVKYSSVTGTVKGNNYVGGLTGYNNYSNIINCFSQAAVARVSGGTGTVIGSMIGFNAYGYVDYNYCSGAVTYIGTSSPTDKGFIGQLFATSSLEGNFFNTQTSGQTTGAGATGINTAQMQSASTFTNAGWDFNYIWSSGGINGFPAINNRLNLIQPGGSGTEGSPYLISSLNNLYWVSQTWESWNKYFQQTADIDASATNLTGVWKQSGWHSIGLYIPFFQGSYDGANYTISNLYINRPTRDNIGLFGNISNAIIKNIKLVSATLTGSNYVGMIGQAQTSTISNCQSSGTFVSVQSCGGIAGYTYNSQISYCYSSATVSGNWTVGGLIGSNYSNISFSGATGNAVAGNMVGGLLGSHQTGEVMNCYSTGNVTQVAGGYNSYYGSFIGSNTSSTITNCYSTGSVTSEIEDAATMGTNRGFIGYEYSYMPWETPIPSVFTNNFFDSQTTGHTSSMASSATPKTTAQMKAVVTYTNWDFKDGVGNDYWNIGNSRNNNYPYLNWQYPSDPILPVAPSAQPVNMVFSIIKSGSDRNIKVSYTASASAEKYIVIRKTGSAPSFVPADGTEYSTGSQGDSYVVYSGALTSATDLSVTASTIYNYKVYAFNGSGGSTKYLTTSPLSGFTSSTENNNNSVQNTTGTAAMSFPNQGVTVNFPSGTTGTSLTVVQNLTAPAANFSAMPGIRGLQNMYFSITSTNATPGNYSLILDFSGLVPAPSSWNSFKVLKRANSTSPWLDITTLGGSIASRQTDGIWGKFTINGLSTFSEFTLGEGANIYTVTSAANSGAGTLRDLVSAATAGDFINFDTAQMGTDEIVLSSTLLIDKDLTIRAEDAGVKLKGNNCKVLQIGTALQSPATPIVRIDRMFVVNGDDAENRVGGIDNYGQLTMVNCVVSDNADTGSLEGTGAVGGILSNGDLTLVNCTLANNTGAAADGGIGAVYCNGTLNVYNTIIYGNHGQYKSLAYSSVNESYNSLYEESLTNLEDSGQNNVLFIQADPAANNLFATNPRFVGSTMYPQHPYLIIMSSPCADAGDDSYSFETTDIRGTSYSRKLNKATEAAGTIDMGAYEFKYSADHTLPVTLSAFTAVSTNSGNVTLSWTTQSESNMQGYYLFRNQAADLATAENITFRIIQSENLSTENQYSYKDSLTAENTEYNYWLKAVAYDGSQDFYGPIKIKTGSTTPETPAVPLETALKMAYPNPFNPVTWINFSLKEEANVNVTIYNIKGERVKTLLNTRKNAGNYKLEWNGTDDQGKNVGTGIYFYKMKAGKYNSIKKMMMLK